jgi:hypothetical protein
MTAEEGELRHDLWLTLRLDHHRNVLDIADYGPCIE